MPKRGQRQPYQLRFLYPNGIGATHAYANLGELDREARVLAQRGADVKILRREEDGSRWQLFAYTPDYVFSDFTPPLGVISQEDVNAWMEARYREFGAPFEVNRVGEPKPKADKAAPAPAPAAKPREDVVLDKPVQVHEMRAAEVRGDAPMSTGALMAGLEILGVDYDGVVTNSDPGRGTQFLLSREQVEKLVRLAMHAPEGLR